jgi:hypothetical protein
VSTRVVSTPAPQHRCLLPGHFEGLPSSRYDTHYEPVGTIIECEVCGTRYASEKWPDPAYYGHGQAMVGNHWVRMQRPSRLRRWLGRRRG